MKICYPKARKSSIKGPYVFRGKEGQFHLRLGCSIEVKDALGHEAIGKDGDIIKLYSELDEDSLEKMDIVPENKMMEVSENKEALMEEKAKLKAVKKKAKQEAEAAAKAAKEKAEKKSEENAAAII